MPSDVTIIIAEAKKLGAMRTGLHLVGRPLYFTDNNLVSAFESIRAHRPPVVALEAHFADSAQGHAFIERVHALKFPATDIQLATFVRGDWTIGPLAGGLAAAEAKAGLDTRRAPRFRVADAASAVIDGRPTNLVNVSVMGAQVVSSPALRPNQKIKIALPDEGETLLKLSAQVAWSVFEKPQPANPPHYRAGMEFTDASAQALEDFCERHCSDAPRPFRP